MKRKSTNTFACLLPSMTFITLQKYTLCLRRSVISSSPSLAAVFGE